MLIITQVVVNNIGGGRTDYELDFHLLHELPDTAHDKMERFNWGAARGWTLLTLPGMHARRRGRIIFCSSMAFLFAYQEGLYGASKGAMLGLTHTLNNEYYAFGVRAEALIIGAVATPALGMPEPDAFGYIVSAAHLASNALDLFGWKEIYAATLGHAVFHTLGSQLPVMRTSNTH